MSERRKVVASLNPDQYRVLRGLMEEDHQDNYTFYIAYLAIQERKRRDEDKGKRKPGRPVVGSTEEIVYYPSPDKHVSFPYTLDELRGYYEMRKEPLPDPLPAPLTKEELKKYDLN